MNHYELIQIAKTLGYRSITDRGLCRGFSMMWCQAVCANDLGTFKDRLKLLDQYKADPQKLATEIELIRNKCKNKDYLPTKEEQKFLDIPPFFDGIALYLSPHINGDVFNNFYISQVQVELISKYTAPKDHEGMKKVFSTTDQYTKKDLTQFIMNLEKKMDGKSDTPINFSTQNHAVSARPLGNGVFEYIDTNSNVNGNMTHWVGDANGLSNQLFSSFNHNNDDQNLNINTSILMPINGLQIDFEDCRNNAKITQLQHDSKGATALDKAICENDIAMIRRIDFNKIDINQVNSIGATPIILASFYNSKEVYEFLLAQKQTDVNSRSPDGKTVLHMFVNHDDFDSVNNLLKDTRLNLPHNPHLLLNDLMCSNNEQAFDVTKKLLEENKISANPQKDKYWSPLHIACAKDKEKIATLLLSHGANINVQDEQGKTPTHIVAEYGNSKTIDQLIKNKPDFNIKNKKGLTAFDLALQNSHMDMALKLLPETNLDSENFGKHWSLKSMSCTPEMKNNILKKGLEDYIKNRESESEYRDFLKLGYSKSEKSDAAKALLQHLDDPKKELSPEHTKILNNGRLSHLFNQYQDIKQDGIDKSTQSINKTLEFKKRSLELKKQGDPEVDTPTNYNSPLP